MLYTAVASCVGEFWGKVKERQRFSVRWKWEYPLLMERSVNTGVDERDTGD